MISILFISSMRIWYHLQKNKIPLFNAWQSSGPLHSQYSIFFTWKILACFWSPWLFKYYIVEQIVKILKFLWIFYFRIFKTGFWQYEISFETFYLNSTPQKSYNLVEVRYQLASIDHCSSSFHYLRFFHNLYSAISDTLSLIFQTFFTRKAPKSDTFWLK